MTTTEKTCFKCNQTKSREDFYRHPQMGDGLLGKCKDCTKKDVRKNRLDNAEYYLAYDRARANNPDRVEARQSYAATARGRAAQRNGAKAWAERNPEKIKAQNALNNAVRDGLLIKPTVCPSCREETESRLMQGHHHDYSKPLDVHWMCVSCHAAHHKAERNLPRLSF